MVFYDICSSCGTSAFFFFDKIINAALFMRSKTRQKEFETTRVQLVSATVKFCFEWAVSFVHCTLRENLEAAMKIENFISRDDWAGRVESFVPNEVVLSKMLALNNQLTYEPGEFSIT